MLKYFLILSTMILISANVICSQDKDNIKLINKNILLKADTKKMLHKYFYNTKRLMYYKGIFYKDSILTYEYKKKYWFTAQSIDGKSPFECRIFCFNPMDSSLDYVKDIYCEVSANSVSELHFYAGELFDIHSVDQDRGHGKIGYEQIRIIDADSLKVKKIIKFEKGLSYKRIKIVSDTLLVDFERVFIKKNTFAYILSKILPMHEKERPYLAFYDDKIIRLYLNQNYETFKREELEQDIK